MVKGIISQKTLKIVNVYAPSNKALEYMNWKLKELQEEIANTQL